MGNTAKCPECGNTLLIPDYAWENMRNYQEDVNIVTVCCNKIVHVKPHRNFSVTKVDLLHTTDDWGNQPEGCQNNE